MSEKSVAKGFTYGLSAYLMWGSFPLIIAFLSFASPWEIVVWRIVFGFLTAAIIIGLRRDFKALWQVVKNRGQMKWIVIATVLIMINWQVYVIGIASGHVIETSLGYFINPIVTILLAVVFLHEKLRPAQWVAVSVASVAVIILTVDYGHLPWIALTLATSFSIYGLAKNRLGGKVSALNSFAFESGVLLPVALIQFLLVASTGPGIQFAAHGFWGSFGLVFFGVMTAIPLILFGTAARHLSLSTIGFMQFQTPIIQFSLGLFYFGEEMPVARWIGFALVWLALAFLMLDMLRRRSKR